MSYKDPEEERRYRRETYALLKRLHLCTCCKTRDEYTESGSPYCYACRELMRIYNQRYREMHREEYLQYQRDRKQRLIAEGKCVICGKASAWGGHTRCMDCSLRQRKKAKEKYRDTGLPKQIYNELGLCTNCGAPRMEGVNKYGEPIKVCEKCYSAMTRNLKKARDAYLDKYGKTWVEMQSQRIHEEILLARAKKAARGGRHDKTVCAPE